MVRDERILQGTKNYLPSLDGWRAIAILLVIFYHAIEPLRRAYGPQIEWLLPLLQPGAIGVSIFFGISGVLITSRMLEENRVHGRIHLLNFYIRRLFRIIPPILLLLAVYCILMPSAGLPVSWIDCFRALFFASNYGPEPTWYLAHTWSLSVEEHFYLFWPLLLIVFGSLRAIRFGIFASLTITIWRIADIHYSIVPSFVGISPWRSDSNMDFLLWGAVVGCLMSGKESRSNLNKYLTPTVTLALVLSLIAATALLGLNSHSAHPVRFYHATIIPLVLAGTILHSEQWLSRCLEWKALRWIGRLSYSLYLWQQLFVVPDDVRIVSFGRWQEWPFNIAAALVCATASYYLVEKPFIRLGHKLARPASERRADLAHA